VVICGRGRVNGRGIKKSEYGQCTLHETFAIVLSWGKGDEGERWWE
jgi:hypothetical protein